MDIRQTLARTQVYSEINRERDRQDEKFGWLDKPGSTLPGDNEWKKLVVLGEEFGEVAEALLELDLGNDTVEHVEQELVQVAAVCVAWLEAARIKRNIAEHRPGAAAYDFRPAPYRPRWERPCVKCGDPIVYDGDELVHAYGTKDHRAQGQGRQDVAAANREACQSQQAISFGGVQLPRLRPACTECGYERGAHSSRCAFR